METFLLEPDSAKFQVLKLEFNKQYPPMLLQEFETVTGHVNIRIDQYSEEFNKEITQLVKKQRDLYG